MFLLSFKIPNTCGEIKSILEKAVVESKLAVRLTATVLALGAVIVALPTAAALSFSPMQTIRLGGVWYIASADFNNDGFPDLVSAEGFSDAASVLLGNGDGTFDAHTIFRDPEADPVVAVATGDFNRDGNADVAVLTYHLSRNVDTLTILLGSGDGTFTHRQTLTGARDVEPPLPEERSLAVGDLTGDGRLSVVVQASVITVFLGNGDGSFQTALTYEAGLVPRSVTIGDFNSDRIADIAVSNAPRFREGSITVLPGLGNGRFGAAVTTSLGSITHTEPVAMAAMDLNDDGILDVLTTAERARGCWNTIFCSGGTSIGVGDATFQPLQFIPFDVSVKPPPFGAVASPRGIALGDLNGDSIPDLVLTANNMDYPVLGDDVYVAEGLGDGLFDPLPLRLDAGRAPIVPIIADFNRDGRPDIAVALEADGIGIFLNTTQPMTARPMQSSRGPAPGPRPAASAFNVLMGTEEIALPVMAGECQWSALGSGIKNLVYGLEAFDDGSDLALYGGGYFTTAGGATANRIAKWDGRQWSALSSGMDFLVIALTVFDDGNGPALYAAGGFSTAGEVRADGIAKWDGTNWSALGSGLDVGAMALTVFDDGGSPALYAGGAFFVAGNRIAKWDGRRWSALASGVNNAVYALAVFDDGNGPALYAGGYFTTAGGATANRIAKWDGRQWSALGSGMDAGVMALAVFDDGSGPALYAGGAFTTAGGVNANRIAKWDGRQWSALGSGMNYVVRALTVFNHGSGPALYAGGAFTTAGGVNANRIAKWDGRQWSALGSGMNAGVLGLQVFNDGSGPALYAGGGFTTSGGVRANGIARWRCTLAPATDIEHPEKSRR